MPLAWEKRPISELTEVVGRGKSPVYADRGGRPGLNQACIHWAGLDLTRTKQVTDAHFETLPVEKVAQKGDVLLNSTGTGTLGRVGYWDSSEKISFDSHVTLLRFKREHVGKFFYYWLGTHEAQRLIDIFCVTGSTNQIELARRPLLEIKVPHPSLQRVQEAIVECIDAVQAEIEAIEKVIAKQERVRAGLLQALLTRGIDENGEIRDPRRLEFSKKHGLFVPASWDVLSIGEIASFVGSGVTPKGGSDVYLSSGIPFIRSQNVLDGELVYEDMAHIDETIHHRMSRTVVRNGDALLNITGASIGRSCSVPTGFPESNVNQHVCIIRVADAGPMCGEFVSKALRSHLGKNQIWTLIAGGNREGLNFQQIRSIRLPWPQKDERTEIVRLIDTASMALAQNVNQLLKLKRLKTGLMRDLLGGRVSVEPLLDLPPAPTGKMVNP